MGRRWVSGFALSVYLVVVLRYVLFKVPGAWQMVLGGTERPPLEFRLQWSNFVPFRTILNYLSGNAGMGVALQNLLGNIVLFVPMGILVPLVFPGLRRLPRIAGTALGTSLALEAFQLFTGLGIFDIDDLVLNVSGAVVGAVAYHVLRRYSTGTGGTRDRSAAER